jgi:hypothetical protein
MRRLLLFPAAVILSLVLATSAFAASATVNPVSQTHAHNVSSHWTLSWGNTSPFHVIFAYGDGFGLLWQNTTLVSASPSYGFSPCPGDPTTYTQVLNVYDGWVNSTGGYKGFASDPSTAHEATGTPC